jgi:uncharacterized protein
MRPTVHITGVDPPAGALGQRRELVPRRAEHLVTEALGDIRVVALDDARQTGKSALARLTARTRPNTAVRLLDDPATLRAARDDPAGFVEHDGLMVIDEVQLTPELFRSIKVVVDAGPRPVLRPRAVRRRPPR